MIKNKIIFKNVLKKFTTSQVVTPWKVEGKIDYKKLVEQFGTELIDEKIIEKMKTVLGRQIHPWITRNIFFTHRGLNSFLSTYERGEPVFLYTGRGPSSEAMHLGHLVPFLFTKWLQDAFNCPLIIQISDEEKSAFKQKNFNEIYKQGFDNAKDIIACGFDPKKTFIFSNRDYRLKCKTFELLTTEMKFKTNLKEIKKIFGLTDESNIFMYDWPFYQTAAAYYLSYPHIFKGVPAYCLVPHAIDQDPYFRLARDLSAKMNLPKPSNIMSSFIPSLSGGDGKMSSSTGQDTTIFLNDDVKIMRQKIMKHSFSGGGGDGSLSDHKKYGGNPNKDIAFQYLRYFELDDDKLNELQNSFIKGEISCGEIKKLLADKLEPILSQIQEKRSKVDKYTLEEFYSDKPMDSVNKSFVNNKEKIIEEEEKIYKYLGGLGIEFITKYHDDLKIIQQDVEKENDLKSCLRGVLCKSILFKGDGKDFYLCIMHYDKNFNIKELKKKLDVSRLMFAEKDTVKYLFSNNNTDVINFVLSPFNLINFMNHDTHSISIVFDNELEHFEYLNFNPSRSDASTSINYKNTIKFLSSFNLNLRILSI
jgi:tryptophanyl-tRNA synthetase